MQLECAQDGWGPGLTLFDDRVRQDMVGTRGPLAILFEPFVFANRLRKLQFPLKEALTYCTNGAPNRLSCPGTRYSKPSSRPERRE